MPLNTFWERPGDDVITLEDPGKPPIDLLTTFVHLFKKKSINTMGMSSHQTTPERGWVLCPRYIAVLAL